MGRRAVGKMKTFFLRERMTCFYEVKRFLTACICLLFEIVSQQNANFHGENGSKKGNLEQLPPIEAQRKCHGE